MDNMDLDKSRKIEYLLLFFVFLITVGMFMSFFEQEASYKRYETENTSYEKARVSEVREQNLVSCGINGEYYTGYQQVRVCLQEGKHKGKELVLDNYVTLTHNVIVKKGMHIILYADRPEGVEPYYSIYNYDRSNGTAVAILAFLILTVIIGRYRGVRAAIGLAFTLAVTMNYMIPSLYEGKNVLFTISVTLLSAVTISSFCISGLSIKSVCNMLNTMLGVGSAVAIYFILTKLLHLQGGSLEDAEALQLISNDTGLSLSGVMFAGVIIGALGAVMDVAVSLSAALWELKMKNPLMTKQELCRSGLNVGKDMIGTMINTLIFAFLGGSLSTLFIYISYGVNLNQFLSSDFLAMELAMALAGSGAVMITVPVSALVCGIIFEKGVKV